MNLKLLHCDTCDCGTPQRVLSWDEIAGLGVDMAVVATLQPGYWGHAVCLRCRTVYCHICSRVEADPDLVARLLSRRRRR